MQDAKNISAPKSNLPLILIMAVIQGWALYGLYYAVKHTLWPATDSPWLIGLYTVAVSIPTTIQLLAAHARQRATWTIVALLLGTFFYFGWHQGAAFYDIDDKHINGGSLLPYGFVLTVLWLMALPFIQARLADGRWTTRYELLFSSAWRNHMILAEAGLFTGLFWLLLFLWASLFHMLGIDFFKDLFSEPIFIYPVTSLAFGIALHLIGSIERWIAVVLEQILNVLKWLAIVASVILVFFTIALIFKLPTVVFTGQRAVGAAWLLWLVAVVVLLFNAAFRDGSVDRPYPEWLGRTLKCTMPLTVIIALTSLYALIIRASHYGLTLERIWAFVVASAALAYAVGYSLSVFRSGRWMSGIAPVNVVVSIALIAVLAATLTPLLSPYRLSANSQYRMAMNTIAANTDTKRAGENPFHYLRFNAGRYGQQKLQELADLQNHPQAESIRAMAKAAQAQTNKWNDRVPAKVETTVDQMAIYPTGRKLDADLQVILVSDLKKSTVDYSLKNATHDEVVGVFSDLNDDGIDEFVLQSRYSGLVYQRQSEKWVQIAKTHSKNSQGCCAIGKEKLVDGDFSAALPEWKDLIIRGHAFYVTGE